MSQSDAIIVPTSRRFLDRSAKKTTPSGPTEQGARHSGPQVIFESTPAVGHFELTEVEPCETGQPISLRMSLRVGPEGLPMGSRIRFGLPNTAWEAPRVPFVRYWEGFETGDHRHYVPFKRVNTVAEVDTAGSARVHLDASERMMGPDLPSEYAFWRYWITATVESDDLRQGDVVTVLYGVTDHGESLPRCQRWPGRVGFVAFVGNPEGAVFRQPTGSPAYVEVHAGAADHLQLFVPSQARPAARVLIKTALTDRYVCRPEGNDPGQPLSFYDGSGEALPSGVTQGHTARQLVDAPEAEGVHRVRVVDATGREAWSNPMVVSSRKTHLAWGDLHAQSRFHVFNDQTSPYFQAGSSSISVGEPSELLAYARDVAGLDFVAITDQGGIYSPGWEATQQAVRDAYEPGRFIPLKGFEAGTLSGHRNVIFAGDEVEPPEDPRTFSLEPQHLFAHYRGRRDVIMIPHHVKVWTDWQHHDPELEPIMEIYSTWGSSEAPGVDAWWDKGQTPNSGAHPAWQRGYRMGVIASSDTHVGMPGRSVREGDRGSTCQNFPAGLAGVWCDSLDRQSIFESLRRRSCYGTTGARIYVDFFANGRPMGEELPAGDSAEPRHFSGRVVGTHRLERVEILRNNRVVFERRGEGRDELVIDWTDEACPASLAWYYLRVTQDDWHRAWTSPIWFVPSTD